MTKERSAIIETAQLVYNDLATPYQDAAYLTDADEDVEKIAAAILAERERCAKIADDLSAHLLECRTCDVSDTFDPPTVLATCSWIADKIRKGE